MNITTLNEDLEVLLKNWIVNPNATPAQQAQWPQSKPLQHKHLANDNPDCLRLLVKDGGDGSPVFSVGSSMVGKFFLDNEEHRWPSDRDLIRLGRFFHLELERILSLVLKAQWERFFQEQAKIDMNGKTKRSWAPKFQRLPLLEALKSLSEEARQLSVEFNPGLGRGANGDELFYLFEDQGHYVTQAGYNHDTFQTLLYHCIIANIHLFGIHSSEINKFVAEQQKQIALLKDSSAIQQEEFWRARLAWIHLVQKLEDEALYLYREKLKIANIKHEWLICFSEIYLKVMEAQQKIHSLQRRIGMRKSDPKLSSKELHDLEQKALEKERESIKNLKQEIDLAKIQKITGSDDVIPLPLGDYQKNCKVLLRKIYQLTHPDKWQKGFTEKQQEELRRCFEEAQKIDRMELGSNHPSLNRLQEIFTRAEEIYVIIGLDLDVRDLIQGETIADQIAWLNNECQRLERNITNVRNEMVALAQDRDLKEKVAMLDSEETITSENKRMEEQLAVYQLEIQKLEKELASLLRSAS